MDIEKSAGHPEHPKRPLKNICLHLTKKVMTENKELGTIHIKIKVVAFSLTVTLRNT